MASVYRKNNIVYMSWYDSIKGKSLNKSLKLKYSPKNMREAKKIATSFQNELDKEIQKLKSIGIVEVTLQDAIEHFIRNNINKNKKTISDYNRFFKLFTATFPYKTPCSQLKKLNVEEWLSYIHTLKYQKNTLFNYYKVLKKFIRFLSEYSYISSFVLNSDLAIKPEIKPIIVFDSKHLEIILKELKSKNDNFLTLMYCFLYTGLRPSDLLNWKVEDINLKKKTVQYFEQKINDYMIIPLHDDLIPILKKRIEACGSGRIFEYKTIGNMGKAFRRFLDSIKLTGYGYTMRTFRKSFISQAHDLGIDLATVSKLVGHKHISTTQKYYTKIGLRKQSCELKKYKIQTVQDEQNT